MPTTVRVTWPAAPADEFVTGYQVKQSKDGGPFNVAATVQTNQFDLLNPTPGVYAFKIAAVNLAGVGPESPAASSPTLPSPVGTPTVVVITS